jgi:hypothetical protein
VVCGLCGIELQCFCVVLICCSCLGFIRVVFVYFALYIHIFYFVFICFDLYSSKVKERNRLYDHDPCQYEMNVYIGPHFYNSNRNAPRWIHPIAAHRHLHHFIRNAFL